MAARSESRQSLWPKTKTEVGAPTDIFTVSHTRGVAVLYGNNAKVGICVYTFRFNPDFC